MNCRLRMDLSVIPKAMRPEMLTKAHASHQGVLATQRLCRDIIFWPRMATDIKDIKCSLCEQHQSSLQKEPMMSSPIPQYPYQVVSSDCFEVDGTHFVVIVDHYSDFISVKELPDLTSRALIETFKENFSMHGIPSLLISDNGPNYAAAEFAEFVAVYEFQHVTSSPHHPKSNGRAEAAVKVAKGLVRKARKDGSDLHLMLLEQRNTPSQGMDTSPAQRLMSRRTKSVMPAKESLYKPEVPEDVPLNLQRRKQRNKFYHDKHSKVLPNLIVGQPVRVQSKPHVNKQWSTATVSDVVGPRSYVVKSDGHALRRNRVHIRSQVPTMQNAEEPAPNVRPKNVLVQSEPAQSVSAKIESTADPQKQSETQPSDKVLSSPSTATRSGRISKPPSSLRDFVKP